MTPRPPKPPPASDVDLRRVLGPVSATCIVVGAIIGVGIFFTPTSVARIAGNGHLALWTWVAGGVVALLGALTFAELGGMYGRAGGQYEILRDSYGSLVAFCFVFCNSTAIVAGGIAIIAMVCAENLAVLMTGSVPAASAVAGLAVVLIALLAGANFVGVRWGAGIQNVTVFAKVAVLLVIALLAAFTTGHDAGAATPVETIVAARPWIALLFAGLVPALFAYGGWQHVLWMGGEVREPRRNLPLATILGVSIVVVVYVAVNWAYLHLLGHQGVSESRALASDAVAVAWPSAGARFVAGAVALSAFGVLNEQILAGPRLLFGMAHDGRFFALFARVHRRFATPAPAIFLIAMLALTLVVVAGKDGIDRLLTGVVLVDAVFFALTGAALIVLRVRRPDADRPARVPLYPVVPALFVLFEMAIIAGAFQIAATRSAAWIGVCWVGLALGCYGLFFRSARRTN